jgi:hypothetical protein
MIDVLRRAALQGLTDKSKMVGLTQLQYVGCPHAGDNRPKNMILPRDKWSEPQ